MGLVCLTECKFYADTDRGELPYEPDILAYLFVSGHFLLIVVVEIDGKTHDNKIPRGKDKWRDKWFWDTYNIPTARYQTYDVVGGKRVDDETHKDEFWFRVSEAMEGRYSVYM
jgi:hypothetical protein